MKKELFFQQNKEEHYGIFDYIENLFASGRNIFPDRIQRGTAVTVHFIEGIVQAGELGNDHQQLADADQHRDNAQRPGHGHFQIHLEHIRQVHGKTVDHQQRRYIHKKIADPHHPVTGFGCVSVKYFPPGSSKSAGAWR